jgi:hypothetical protein
MPMWRKVTTEGRVIILCRAELLTTYYSPPNLLKCKGDVSILQQR